jgi:hypothetical protein
MVYEPGPQGGLRVAHVRKRFPYLGMIPLVYALSGTMVCAGISWALRVSGGMRFFPTRLVDAPLPAAPSMANILFGAGLPETALTCGLLGLYLWRALWKTRISAEEQARGFWSILRALSGRALGQGILLGILALPLGAFGLYLRTAPANQPWVLRPLFGLLATPVLWMSALGTGLIPLVLLLLGMLMGWVTAVAAAAVWREFPEEPVDL